MNAHTHTTMGKKNQDKDEDNNQYKEEEQD